MAGVPLYQPDVPLFVPGGVGQEAAPVAAPMAAPVVPTGKRVNVLSPDGKAWSVDESELPSVTEKGWKPETREQSAIRKYVDENKGLSGTAKVALDSFLNEASFGIMDAVYRSGADPLSLKEAEALKRDHAAANILGGVGGFAASFLYGGPVMDTARAAKLGVEGAILGVHAAEAGAAKLATKAATTAAYRTAETQLAEKAAGALVTERLIQAGMPAAEAAIAGPGIVRKMAASAAGTAVEGGIFKLPEAVTEAVLGDPDRAGETLLAGLGGGALIGAMGPAAGAIFKATTSGIGKVKLPGSLRELAGGLSEEQAFKSLANNHASLKKAAKEAIHIEGGQKGIGRTLLDENLVKGFREDAEDYAGRLLAAKQEAGNGVGAMYTKLDQLGADTGLSVADLSTKMRLEVLEPLSAKPGFEGIASKVEAYIESFEGKTIPIGKSALAGESAVAEGNVSFGRLHEVRVALDELVYRNAKGANPAEHIKELRGIRRMIQEELVEKGEKLAKKFGDDFAAPLKKANLKYARLSAAEAAASDFAEQRALTNRSFSPTDYGVGGIGALAGALANPLGAAAGVAAAVGHKLVREEGNAMLAKGLDSYSKGRGMAGLLEANHAVAVHLDRIPRALLGTGDSAARATLPTHALASIAGGLRDRKPRESEDIVADYMDLADRLTELHSNPARMPAEIERLSAPFHGDAPTVTTALTVKATGAAKHLYDTMPRVMVMPATPFAPERKTKPSKSQIAEWARRWQVVQTPFVVVERIADRTLSRADVETLKAVYPRLHEEIVRKVTATAADGSGKTIPYGQRQKLSFLLGVPLERTNVAAFQDAHAARFAPPGDGGGPASRPRASGGKTNMPTLQTDAQRLTAKT